MLELTTMGARELLRAAIAERDQAAEVEANAARAVVRAKQLLDDAERQLSMLSGVDAEISTFHATAIKEWATNGGDRPTGELPAHLTSNKALLVEVEAKVAAARQAHETLKAELLSASQRVHLRKADVRRSAGAVLTAEAEPIVEQLRQARKLVFKCEDQLRSLGSVHFAEADGRSVKIEMPAGMFEALNETAPPMLAGNVPKPFAIELECWMRFFKSLQRDPNSTLE